MWKCPFSLIRRINICGTRRMFIFETRAWEICTEHSWLCSTELPHLPTMQKNVFMHGMSSLLAQQLCLLAPSYLSTCAGGFCSLKPPVPSPDLTPSCAPGAQPHTWAVSTQWGPCSILIILICLRNYYWTPGDFGQYFAQGGFIFLAAANSMAASGETLLLRAAAIPVTIYQG